MSEKEGEKEERRGKDERENRRQRIGLRAEMKGKKHNRR